MIKLDFLAAFAGLAVVAASAAPADARGGFFRGHGPNGAGYAAGRHVSSGPGSIEVRRGFRTEAGRWVRTTRSAEWGDGSASERLERSYSDGTSATRSRSIARNEDERSITRSISRTGRSGNSQHSSVSIRRTEDGYSRSRSASTEDGRGYSASSHVSFGEDTITID